MLRALIRFCIHEPLVLLLATVAVLGVGWYATQTVPIDAIPNVGENQVIVLTEWPGRSPKDVEDQITYPLSVALLAVPGAESVRGKSLFGYSFVQVTFDDHVDFYWARSRVAEQLTTVTGKLPAGVSPTMGPDATGLGQVFYYTLRPSRGMDLAELRSIQDFVVKYALQSVEGVSEVASVGGYVRQYQIEIDPEKLRFQNIPLAAVVRAMKEANIEVGAKVIESGGMEYIIRGKGFIGAQRSVPQTINEIEDTVVLSRDGVPVRIRNLGHVQLGPDFRRGALDLNGSEAVGGIVVMRFGENPRLVIDRVKKKIAQIEPALSGVTFDIIYDRTGLVNETVATLSEALYQETIITVVVILLFLLHFRSSLIVALTLPIAVLMSFVAMLVFGVDANIMSLAGIAIAIGEVVDLGIIVSENVFDALSEWERQGSPGGRQRRSMIIYEAACEVAPAVITAVSTTIVSFLPVFFLVGRDFKLFAPLAITKTFAMVAAVVVAITLVPAFSRLFLRTVRIRRLWAAVIAGATAAFAGGAFVLAWVFEDRLVDWAGSDQLFHFVLYPAHRFGIWGGTGLVGLAVAGVVYVVFREQIRPVDQNPTSRLIHSAYAPILRFLLQHKAGFAVVPSVIVLLGMGAWFGLPGVLAPLERVAKSAGAELNDVPGYVEFKHVFQGLKSDDWIALDEGSWFYMPTLYPASSFSQTMQVLQTQDMLISRIPEVEDVLGKIGRAESALDPAPAAMIETYVMLKPKTEWREGVTEKSIWDQINRVATLPGVTPASPLQPIEGRVVMLQSGIKAPMAVRIYGDSLDGLAEASRQVAEVLRGVPYVNASTVNPDIVLGKPYVEFEVDRDEAARYGMSVMMVNQIIETALGGMNLTTTYEGRERYPIRIRYERGQREQIDELRHLPVVTTDGEVVPLARLARMQTTWGPGMISSEDARLVAHVSFAPSGLSGDLETVDRVVEALAAARSSGELDLPTGYDLQPVGSFQNQIEANRRLLFVVPAVILINLLLIYLQFRDLTLSLVIFSAIPVAFAGGMMLLAFWEVEMNTAVWVGFIALFGIAIDDGIVIATYLDQVFTRRWLRSIDDIRSATVEAGLKRIRPCLMTTFTTFAALLPVLLATGRGADVAKAMAIPVYGGMVVELITLFVVPVAYCAIKEFKLRTGMQDRHWEGTDPQPEVSVVPLNSE